MLSITDKTRHVPAGRFRDQGYGGSHVVNNVVGDLVRTAATSTIGTGTGKTRLMVDSGGR